MHSTTDHRHRLAATGHAYRAALRALANSGPDGLTVADLADAVAYQTGLGRFAARLEVRALLAAGVLEVA